MRFPGFLFQPETPVESRDQKSQREDLDQEPPEFVCVFKDAARNLKKAKHLSLGLGSYTSFMLSKKLRLVPHLSDSWRSSLLLAQCPRLQKPCDEKSTKETSRMILIKAIAKALKLKEITRTKSFKGGPSL